MRLQIACALCLPALSHAGAVDVSPVGLTLLEVIPVVIQLGLAVLGIWLAIDVFRYLREVIGAANAPVPRNRLAELEARLQAEDAAAGVEWRDVGTGKSNLDYEAEAALAPTYREATIEESASWQRVNDHHDAREDYATKTATEAMAAHSWDTAADGSMSRTITINIMGVDRHIVLDYADEFASARDDALFDYDKGDGLTTAQRISEKEDRKGYDMQAMRTE